MNKLITARIYIDLLYCENLQGVASYKLTARFNYVKINFDKIALTHSESFEY